MAESTLRKAPIQSDLKPEALGLVSVTMQAITHIAPAIAALFFTQFLVSLAGLTSPLAYVIAVAIVLMLGNTLIQFSRQLPSAGGYYTYVSRALGARAGFLTSWMFILYSPLAGSVIYGFFGFIVAGEIKASYNVDISWIWWVLLLIGAPLIAFVQYRGIELSARTLLVAGSAEILIVLSLALTGFLNPGPGGFSLSVFNPGNVSGNALGFSGFALGIVLAVQGLTGWEAAAPLAEETSAPKRNVPRSVLLAIGILGVFLVFTYWGIITGFGVNNIKGIVNSPDLPGLALARKVWGGGWWLILLAFMSSVFAVCLATANVSTRMWYSMGRNGAFLKWFATVHPKYKTPTHAIFAQLALSLVVGLLAGYYYHPDVAFFFVDGLILVLGISFVYLIANVGVIFYYWRQRKSEFNYLTHLIFPVASGAVLVWALAWSFPPFCPPQNCPSAPYSYAPLVDGAWLLIGIALLVFYAVNKREDWLKTAGAALGESEDDLSMARVGPAASSRV
jgi:amino acid transporter